MLAGIFHFGAPALEVYAQARDQGQEQAEMRWKVENMTHVIDERNNAIDKHLESTDRRIELVDDRDRQLSERVTHLQGLGQGGFGVLGVLEMLGFLTPIIAKKITG